MLILRERAGQIVDAAKSAVAEPMSELVAEAGKPELLPRRAEQHGLVFQKRNVHVGERAAHAVKIVPPVVIAEDRPGAERRFEPRQFGSPVRIGDRLDLELIPRLEIAEQHDQVGLQRIGGIDDMPDVRQQSYRGRRHAGRQSP